MKNNLFYKVVIILGFFVFIALIVMYVYFKYQNLKFQKPEPVSEDEQEQIIKTYVSIYSEVADNKINLFVEPVSEIGEEVLLSAVELNIKIFADDFENLSTSDQKPTLSSDLTSAGWKFPISSIQSLETGEIGIKLAGYFDGNEGYKLIQKTQILSVNLTQKPENQIFVSEFIQDNTHFFSRHEMNLIPFIIK